MRNQTVDVESRSPASTTACGGLLRTEDLGVSGYESREQLDADGVLTARLESIRLQAGPRMNHGDVSQRNVPKMCLIAPQRSGGAITTRSFIPHRWRVSQRAN